MNTTLAKTPLQTIAPVSLRLDKSLKMRLEKVAQDEDRSLSYIAQKAIVAYLDEIEHKRLIIKNSYEKALNDNEFISQKSMDSWVDSWGGKGELPEPEPDTHL